MPTWRAIAAAVSGWSPVMTMIRMPASWQRATAQRPRAAAGRASRPARGSTVALGVLAPAGARSASWSSCRSRDGSTRSPCRGVALDAPSTRSRSSASERPLVAVGPARCAQQLGSTCLGSALGVRPSRVRRARRPCDISLQLGRSGRVPATQRSRARRRRRRPVRPCGLAAARSRSGRRAPRPACRARRCCRPRSPAASRDGGSAGRRSGLRVLDGRSLTPARSRRASTVHPVLGERSGLVRADHVVEPSVSTALSRLTTAPVATSSRTPTASASVITGSRPSGRCPRSGRPRTRRRPTATGRRRTSRRQEGDRQ